MAQSLKYGQLDIPGIPAGEPVFVLRAQDVAAVATLDYYRREIRGHGAPDATLEGLDRMVGTVTHWQFGNPGRVKVPD